MLLVQMDLTNYGRLKSIALRYGHVDGGAGT